MQNQQPSTLKEIRVHGTQDFPCAFYQTGTRIKGNGGDWNGGDWNGGDGKGREIGRAHV